MTPPWEGLGDLAASRWLAVAWSPFVGSFIGVLIRRVPAGRTVVAGRSTCEHCGTGLAPRELVPLFSWLVQRGRCRHCGQWLGWFYPAVELAAIAIALVAAAAADASTPEVWFDCALGWWLLALGWIDLRSWRLPDAMTLPLIVGGLAATIALDPARLPDRLAAAALGYLGFRAIGWLYRKLRRREGLGRGDAKLLAAGGAWLGTAALPLIVLLAAPLGLAAALAGSLAGGRLRPDQAIPFGPFLALAIWILWLLRRAALP